MFNKFDGENLHVSARELINHAKGKKGKDKLNSPVNLFCLRNINKKMFYSVTSSRNTAVPDLKEIIQWLQMVLV